MENLEILISESFFLGLTLLKETRQGISRSINLSLTIIDLKVVSRELLGPVDLTRAQTFCIHESTEVVVVSEDKDLIFAAFQVMVSSLKSFKNRHKLLIICFVPSLSRDYLSKKKGYHITLTNFKFRKIKIWIFVGYVTRKMLI